MNILVYDDNPDFGGHQAMACHGVDALLADPALDITFMLNPENTRLSTRLSSLNNLDILNAPCITKKLQGLRNRISKRDIQTLENSFRTLNPDVVVCIQGEIEDSSIAVMAARRASIICISYIAIPHSMRYMGSKAGSLRDVINHYLLNQPSRYITISERMKQLLIERGVRKPITIVPNGIPQPQTDYTKLEFSLPQEETIIGMLGRIEFKQKQQDFMVNTFCFFPEQFRNCHLVIAGDGPDTDNLKHIIETSSRKNDITLIPWLTDTHAFYESIDFLMLPSRFEGVPLVMLEALSHGVPVLASRRDGMQEILPETWMFDTENAGELARAFRNIRRNWKNEIHAVRENIVNEMTIELFKTNFHHAITN